MEKAFCLLTLPISNLLVVSNSNNVHQTEPKKVKECVVTYVPYLLPAMSDTRETDADSFWNTKESGFEESDQENIQDWLEYDINDLGYQVLTDDEIIVSAIDDQDPCNDNEEPSSNDHAEK
ncbi:hypothetical protein AVEN_131497-1 [Araneus ventricosus]|uniref:DDE-1 domain-containing protein n=1 Tax=Araneus ventricosus TaxID=182803 RepID=A0A4Y2KKH9_ARAVE|nr:hypothetical protein AVEN_131497-1 [Araneus ventricosus]